MMTRKGEPHNNIDTRDHCIWAVQNGILPYANFQIWQPAYKNTLLTNILWHYYFREIGFETVGLWKTMITRKLSEIMPYYNKLYKTITLDFDIINPTDYLETVEHDRQTTDNMLINKQSNTENTTTGTENVTASEDDTHEIETASNSESYHSDLPQASIIASPINYATTWDKGDSGTTENGSNHGASESHTTNDIENRAQSTGEDRHEGRGTEHNLTTTTRKGNIGNKTPVELIEEYRKSILNIDLMIAEELEDCFMMVY